MACGSINSFRCLVGSIGPDAFNLVEVWLLNRDSNIFEVAESESVFRRKIVECASSPGDAFVLHVTSHGCAP